MKRSPDWRGHQQQPRNPAIELQPGIEYGWLTARHTSRGDRRYTVFTCRCGEQVIRITQHVRAAIEAGNIPCCKDCRREVMKLRQVG